jgi:hypothetical protein
MSELQPTRDMPEKNAAWQENNRRLLFQLLSADQTAAFRDIR